MRYSLILLPTIISVFTAKVYDTPTPKSAEGSNTEAQVEVLTWNIEAASDGSIVQVNGTVEKVYAEFSDNHPELLATAFDLDALDTLLDDDDDDDELEVDDLPCPSARISAVLLIIATPAIRGQAGRGSSRASST
ncbi:hypothetical protein EDB81DRAFT_222474 [Dactylonectria macrodidyma]|uniref:Uncharacterized protein n=1 Tax=Dactylonectria macrodidyma TaxID=307937 RepID=A0A9P9DNU9_9HYPO|nr:hypothetical protein EDB81DRAFT_222474 [Dactylonectria macrodidyma]